MAYHGRNSRIYANGYSDLCEYLQKISVSMSAESPVDTVICDTAVGRGADGIVDGSYSIEGNYDSTTGGPLDSVEAALGDSTLPGVYNILPFGDDTTAANRGLGFVALNNAFEVTGSYDDKVSFSSGGDASAGNGIEITRTLLVLASRDTSGNSATLDNGAATTAGGSAYLQLMGMDETDALTVEIKGSTTGLFTGEETLLGAFGIPVSGRFAERIDLNSLTIPQYLRAYYTITTLASLSFFVAVHRHHAAS